MIHYNIVLWLVEVVINEQQKLNFFFVLLYYNINNNNYTILDNLQCQHLNMI